MESLDGVLRTLEEAKILVAGTYHLVIIQQEWAARGYDLAKTKRKLKPKDKDKDEPLWWDYARRNKDVPNDNH